MDKTNQSVNEIHRGRLSKMDKLALRVTRRVGSMGFFFIVFGWTIVWLGWNVIGPLEKRFDPYPGFVLWLFISNMIQLHLMPLIMIGQNVQGRHAELRAELEFETSKKTEKKMEEVSARLDEQQRMLSEILRKLER